MNKSMNLGISITILEAIDPYEDLLLLCTVGLPVRSEIPQSLIDFVLGLIALRLKVSME